nr:bifunctional nicotinamidase/pyrazinamidase [Candidatus Sigynarchaeota archaeon]
MLPFTVPPRSALLVVDMQYDFMPGGALAVAGGDEIIEPVNECIRTFYSQDARVVLTQDWHPKAHASFASSHPRKKPYDPVENIAGIEPILWPDHCIQGSKGAMIHERVDTVHSHLLLRKGYRPSIDSYSAFVENDKSTRTGLAGYLKENNILRIFICGLAFDYCVYYSAIDALRAGFEPVVFTDLTRAVNFPEGRHDIVKTELEEVGCEIRRFKV